MLLQSGVGVWFEVGQLVEAGHVGDEGDGLIVGEGVGDVWLLNPDLGHRAGWQR